jgi:kinase-associated protein B
VKAGSEVRQAYFQLYEQTKGSVKNMHSSQNFVSQPGAIVAIRYKTGEYIGEVVETPGPRTLVKVLAVLKHPEQGDLHNPYDPDVPMFHERRALSYTEKVNVVPGDIRPYAGEIPTYKESLDRALQAEMAALDRLKRWAERCLGQLEQLSREYR